MRWIKEREIDEELVDASKYGRNALEAALRPKISKVLNLRVWMNRKYDNHTIKCMRVIKNGKPSIRKYMRHDESKEWLEK